MALFSRRPQQAPVLGATAPRPIPSSAEDEWEPRRHGTGVSDHGARHCGRRRLGGTPGPQRTPHSYYSSSFSSSPRQFPSDFTDPILEEGDVESGSDCALEPVTPSAAVAILKTSPRCTTTTTPTPAPRADRSAHHRRRAEARPCPCDADVSAPLTPRRPAVTSRPSDPAPPSQTPVTGRATTRGSTSRIRRTVSNLFRRTNSSRDQERDFAIADTPSFTATDTSQSSGDNFARSGPPPTSNGRFAAKNSSNTTCSNSPPSPGSPLMMAPTHRSAVIPGSPLPDAEDFKKKGRAATGFSFRGRAVNFVGATMGRGRPSKGTRRAASFDSDNRGHPSAQQDTSDSDDKTYPPERLPWPLPRTPAPAPRLVG
ncbi:hypothetical protein ACCO45_010704 [Purpureocillium lilacinum]|uniref:Uncharacterized protein n=1 Tax=Purpureocillium lilacinum TaxID=33203 RepID=A0ACC4DFJ0_PURLI